MKISRKEHAELIGVWRRKVFESNNGVCVCCGNKATEAHHIATRGASSWVMTYDPTNGVPLCHGCHHRFHLGVEVIRKQIHSFYERKNGVSVDWLFARARQPVKKNQYFLEIVRENLGVSEFGGFG